MKGKGCRIKLEQVETLKLMCKIDMSFDDFFNTNGHITFVNKMAAFLNIEPTKIKIVKIIPGSVVLDLAIAGDESEDGESADGGGSSGSGSSDKKLDLSALKDKVDGASKEELSTSLGFKVAEISATHHDTKDYVKKEDVGEARLKWLMLDDHKKDGEGEAIKEVAKPLNDPFVTQWGWIAFGIVLGVAFIALGGY